MKRAHPVTGGASLSVMPPEGAICSTFQPKWSNAQHRSKMLGLGRMQVANVVRNEVVKADIRPSREGQRESSWAILTISCPTPSLISGSSLLQMLAFGSRPQAQFFAKRNARGADTEARRRCRIAIKAYNFLLNSLPNHADNIGPNAPAIATAKPMTIYSRQSPVNKFRPNTRLSKQHINAVKAHTIKNAIIKLRFFFIKVILGGTYSTGKVTKFLQNTAH